MDTNEPTLLSIVVWLEELKTLKGKSLQKIHVSRLCLNEKYENEERHELKKTAQQVESLIGDNVLCGLIMNASFLDEYRTKINLVGGSLLKTDE